MDIDMESYYKGQLDMVNYLYEMLTTTNLESVKAYLEAVYNSTESRVRHGKA